MQLLRVQGGTPLSGKVTLSGSKHSALAILGTVLLMNGKVTLKNFPNINDTHHMLRIIESLGLQIQQNESTVILNASSLSFSNEEMWRVNELRSSILFLGSILVRFGSVTLPRPGGDKLGKRPLDEFLYVLSQFGVEYQEKSKAIEAHLNHELRGTYEFDLCTSTFSEMGNNRTVLALIMAWANRGRTTLKNALILPEIIETCYFLEKISEGSVTIDGIGTDRLVINSPGINAIHAKAVETEHLIGPDKCEYAFWIAAASLTKGDITIINPHPHRDFRNTMRWLRAKLLRPANIYMEVLPNGNFRVNCSEKRATSFDLISTAHEPYGIAFDVVPLYTTILLTAQRTGSSYCFKFKEKRAEWILGLEQIGAKYEILPDGKLVITGVENLFAPKKTSLKGNDIRGASCVLLASLATHGQPITFQGIEHIQRGMENPLEKLKLLGANIELI